MATRISSFFRFSVKRLLLALVGAAMVMGLTQSAALAVSMATDADMTTSAAQESLAQKRQERQAWQSKASASRNVDDNVDSVEEIVDDRLNLDEIIEENQIVEGVKNLFDADKK